MLFLLLCHLLYVLRSCRHRRHFDQANAISTFAEKRALHRLPRSLETPCLKVRQMVHQRKKMPIHSPVQIPFLQLRFHRTLNIWHLNTFKHFKTVKTVIVLSLKRLKKLSKQKFFAILIFEILCTITYCITITIKLLIVNYYCALLCTITYNYCDINERN